MTPAELEAYLVICKKYGVRKLSGPGFSLEIGAPPVEQPDPSKISPHARPLTDQEALFAATEGIEEPEAS